MSEEAYGYHKEPNQRRSHHWDEILEQEAKEQMEEMGCDEQFIECALEELREGHSVTVVVSGGQRHTIG